MRIRVILTGATGMVGEGVLLECLENQQVAEVLIISRKPSGRHHEKLKEIIHTDFYNINPLKNHLSGYDACFFCAGVTSVGKKEEEYYKLTYTLTLHVAEVLSELNPQMTFCYVSGAGTDSTEKGKVMWARVKGKTENHLAALPFKAVYHFRPAIMKPSPGQNNVLRLYKFFAWLYPLLRVVSPGIACTIQEVGRGMINAATKGFSKHTLEVKDIVALAKM